MDQMIHFLERVAIRIRPAGRALTAVAIVLFFVTFFAFSALPGRLLFLVTLVMFWASGLAILHHIYGPRQLGDGNFMNSRIRESSFFVRAYATVFITVWFVFLVSLTVVLLLRIFDPSANWELKG